MSENTRPAFKRVSRTSFVVSKLLERVESHRQAANPPLPSPGGGGDVLSADTPPPSLPMSRKGSVVFPSVELAQRSASLRRNRSALAQSVLQRRRSELFSHQQQPSHSLEVDVGGRRPSSGSAGGRDCGAATEHSVLSSVATLLHTGDVQPRRVAPLKTVATAVVMLVRMQAAVERRRRSNALRLRDLSGPGSDDGGASSPRNTSSYPTTARGGHLHDIPLSSRPAAAPAVGAPAPGSSHMHTKPSVATAALGGEGPSPPATSASAAAAAAQEPSPSSSPEAGGTLMPPDLSDSESDGAADDISFASWDSNDRIDDAHGGSDSDGGQSDGDEEIGTAFFPHPRDIAQLPELMRAHIERRALRSLRRFIVVYRFRRYLNARRARRSPLTIASVPPAVIEASEIFRGWSAAMLEAAFSSAYIQTWYGGTFIAYPNEPQRFVYVVLSGCATELRRRPNGVDAAAVANDQKKKLVLHSKDSDVVCAHQNPVFLRATAAMVQELSKADVGILAVTACTVGVMSVAAVEHAFHSGGGAGGAAIHDPSRAPLCERYKHIRQDRTAVYLQEQIAETTAAIQAESSAATAAAAAMVLSSVNGVNGSKKKTNAAAQGEDDAQGGTATAASPPSLPPQPTPSSSSASTSPASCLQLNLRSSSLLQHITKEQERLLLSRLVPLSFFEGEDVLTKDSEDHKNLYFILRGSMVSVSRYLDVQDTSPAVLARQTSRRRKSAAAGGAGSGAWKDMVFSRWVAGESVGDKAIYFQEPPVFTLRAETNCDLAVLKRSALMQLMESSDRSGLRQAIASGAFVVRANDPVVRLRLSSVRAIPCIEAALQEGLVTEAFVRELHARFRIHVFPATELIASSSASVKSIIVTSTGTAIVDVNGPAPFYLANGVAIGCSMLCNVRWRYAVYATTECEGWVLPAATFVDVCRQHHVLKRMVELSRAQHHILMRTDGSDTTVFEVLTPQQVVTTELAAHGDEAARARLAAQLVMPSHRLLDQRSFLQKLGPDVPLPPLQVPSAVVADHNVVVTSPRSLLLAKRHNNQNNNGAGGGGESRSSTPTPTAHHHPTSTLTVHQSDRVQHNVSSHLQPSLDASFQTPLSSASQHATPRPADSLTSPIHSGTGGGSTVFLPDSNHYVAASAPTRAATAVQQCADGHAPICPGVVLVPPGIQQDAGTVVVPILSQSDAGSADGPLGSEDESPPSPHDDAGNRGLNRCKPPGAAVAIRQETDATGNGHRRGAHHHERDGPRKPLLLNYMNMLVATAAFNSTDNDGSPSCRPSSLPSLIEEVHLESGCDAYSNTSASHGLPQHRIGRSAGVRYARTPPPPLHRCRDTRSTVDDAARRRVFSSSLSRSFTPSAFYRATRRIATLQRSTTMSGHDGNTTASPPPADGAFHNSSRNTDIVGSKAWCLASPSSNNRAGEEGGQQHQQVKSLRMAAQSILSAHQPSTPSDGRCSPLARLFVATPQLPTSSSSF